MAKLANVINSLVYPNTEHLGFFIIVGTLISNGQKKSSNIKKKITWQYSQR